MLFVPAGTEADNAYPVRPILTVTERRTHDLTVSPGEPFPLGATALAKGSVNFSISSEFADRVTLCLFADPEKPWRETDRIPLVRGLRYRWHVRVDGIPPGATYGFRVGGPWEPVEGHLFLEEKLLLDPFAKHIPLPSRACPSMRSIRDDKTPILSDSAMHAPRAAVPIPDDYDWGDDAHPYVPMTDSVFCELHVKGFSKLNPAVPEEFRGTYAGLGHEASIGYLKDLGVTSVQLLPVHQHLDDGFLLERGLVNYWGYNTIGFFAPEARYAATGDPVTEFRDMVKAFHRAGMEVILDVVYNHTGEAGVTGPTCFLRGFDNLLYYHNEPLFPGSYRDFTGCGNSVDLTHPHTLKLVMDSLRYWVTEMHVDGFRFDLAAEMGRSPEKFRRDATFFQAVWQDPVLCRAKMIAEPWDIGINGYQLGNFPNNWCELNGKFRDDVRQFWRGDPGTTGNFATRITGSEAVFAHNHRGPGAGVNLVTSHDGFTLLDLVSYNEKHNLANGEGNRDGDNHNISWNHGVEGPTDDPRIRELRLRQVRNFLATMFCSQGAPFLLAGDERLRTQHGNNNTYCQDNELSWISWDDGEDARTTREFVKKLAALRRRHPSLRRKKFFSGKIDPETVLPDVCWLRPDGKVKQSPDWNSKKSGAFAMLIHGEDGEKALLLLINARLEPTEFLLPKTPVKRWAPVLDTADPTVDGGPGKLWRTRKLPGKSMQIWEQG